MRARQPPDPRSPHTMTTDSHRPDHPHHADPAVHVEDPSRRLSRRHLLGGLGAALGLGAVAASVGAVRAQEVGVSRLVEAADALEPAVRLAPPDTPPPADVYGSDVPAGRIRFPIVVGPDDSCYVGRNFGACRGTGCSRSHEGVDMMADRGLPVIATVAGRLTKRYEDYGSTGGAGNGWTLYDASTDVTFKFFHLDRHSEGLETGDEVVAGQVIGYVGNTGTSGAYSNSNYHLHFEYRPGNVARDSFDLLERPEHVRFG